MSKLILLLLIVLPLQMIAQQTARLPVGSLLPARQVPVHDPVMIKEGDVFYLFCTGNGIAVWSSKDLQTWRKEMPVFSKPPQWAVDTIPDFHGHIWAPDISYYNGQYYLYYSVSAFGKNTSAIGVATNKTLDSSSANFGWIDHGRVIQSYPGKTNWNAIDPNLVIDDKNNPYLVFGSFWEGLKIIKLAGDLLHPAEQLDNMKTIASRKLKFTGDGHSAPVNAGDNAIEAPFIYKKDAYYYLFASIDYCCRGENSTYKIIIGRSQKVDGPYVDKAGEELLKGGGTILLQGDKEWYGVGHNGICSADGKDYIVYHGYDAADGGKSKLKIRELEWDETGWPLIR